MSKKERVRPCPGTCGRWTRHNEMRAAEFPGTVVRSKGGYCRMCLNDLEAEAPIIRVSRLDPEHQANQLRECTGTCGRMTRPRWMTLKQAPDTVRRVDGPSGNCSACHSGTPARKKTRPAADLQPREVIQVQHIPEAYEPQHPVNLSVPAAHGLTSFLNRSRERRQMRSIMNNAAGTGRPPRGKVYA